MIPVSSSFNSAAKATIRKPKAKIEICWTDPFLDSSILVESNSINRGARLFQIADLSSDVPVKWFHLDGICKLNGEFYLMPSTDNEARKTQVSWWGKNRSSAGGIFSPYEIITVSFSSRPVFSVFISGDSAYNEYPVDFNVYFYKDESFIYSLAVTENSDLHYSLSVADAELYDVTSMTLEITRWSAANRVVKISEFYSSIIREYDGDDIVSINILEEMELTNGSLPVGNISCNEIDLALINIDDQFFPGNTQSELHALVKRNRRIKVWFGFQFTNNAIEWVSMGTFWSGDWDTPEMSTVATTTGRDRMELLRKKDFSSSVIYTDKNLYELAEIICESARLTMPDLIYWIDDALKEYVVPMAWFPKKNYMETIRGLVEACLGFAYMDRYDVLIIGKSRRIIDFEYNEVDIVEQNSERDIHEVHSNVDIFEL